jgi:hypothetical protein
MKKWMDACETKDDKCKEQFKNSMEKLVQSSVEENGVWQMMVAASALHQRQEHDLDTLRVENDTLKQSINRHYTTSSSRTGGTLKKRKAENELTKKIQTEKRRTCGQASLQSADRFEEALRSVFPIRSVTDSKNLFIGQYNTFFEEYWLSPIL